MVLTCEETMSNRSAISTCIYAKCSVNGKHITQTREITTINGHITYANFRLHFGLGDAGVIDTLIIRGPSGHFDESLDVEANQFYRAIEDDALEIDFKTTNYIQSSMASNSSLVITEIGSRPSFSRDLFMSANSVLIILSTREPISFTDFTSRSSRSIWESVGLPP